MAMGFAADRNEVVNAAGQNPCTVTSNVAWSANAPLASILNSSLIDAAVSLSLGTKEDPVWLQLAWEHPIDLTYGGILNTNLRQASGYRLEGWVDAETTQQVVTTRTPDGRDLTVGACLTDPADMRFGASNQLRGDQDERDFRLLKTHIHAPVPLAWVRVVRWSLWGGAYKPDNSPDTGYRLGSAWAGDGLLFHRHVGSSGEGVRSNDERTETPGGGVYVEPGASRRTTKIDRTVTDRVLRDQLFLMALRTGKRKPMIWLPDIADPAACALYGGPFRRVDDHQHTYVAPRHTSNTQDLEEVTE